MCESNSQIQGIQIRDAPVGEIEAEQKVLQVIKSQPEVLVEYEDPVKNLYRLKISEDGDGVDPVADFFYAGGCNNGQCIIADLYITDDPDEDLSDTKSDIRQLTKRRQDLLSESRKRNDLIRAVVLQNKLLSLGNSVKYKQRLQNVSNPVLEKNSSIIVSKVI